MTSTSAIPDDQCRACMGKGTIEVEDILAWCGRCEGSGLEPVEPRQVDVLCPYASPVKEHYCNQPDKRCLICPLAT